jgi:hypothetical protein
MAIVTPIVTKYLFAPLFRNYIEHHFARYDHISNIVLMILVLCAFISIAAYAGTSVLFGALLAGTFLSYIPSKHPEAPFVVASREEGEREADKSPTFVHTFERYLVDVQKYLRSRCSSLVWALLSHLCSCGRAREFGAGWYSHCSWFSRR